MIVTTQTKKTVWKIRNQARCRGKRITEFRERNSSIKLLLLLTCICGQCMARPLLLSVGLTYFRKILAVKKSIASCTCTCCTSSSSPCTMLSISGWCVCKWSWVEYHPNQTMNTKNIEANNSHLHGIHRFFSRKNMLLTSLLTSSIEHHNQTNLLWGHHCKPRMFCLLTKTNQAMHQHIDYCHIIPHCARKLVCSHGWGVNNHHRLWWETRACCAFFTNDAGTISVQSFTFEWSVFLKMLKLICKLFTYM